jgi:hypothetical protein
MHLARHSDLQLRRSFIGGSDARIIMGSDDSALVRLGGKSAQRPDRRTCLAISSCSSAP